MVGGERRERTWHLDYSRREGSEEDRMDRWTNRNWQIKIPTELPWLNPINQLHLIRQGENVAALILLSSLIHRFEDVCTFGGIHVPCISLHARCSCGICWAWELPLFLKSFFGEMLLLCVTLSVTCILSAVLMCQFIWCLLSLSVTCILSAVLMCQFIWCLLSPVSQICCTAIVSFFVCLAVFWAVLDSALRLCWFCLQEERTMDSFIKFQVLGIPGWGPDQQNVSGRVPVCFATSTVGAVLLFLLESVWVV